MQKFKKFHSFTNIHICVFCNLDIVFQFRHHLFNNFNINTIFFLLKKCSKYGKMVLEVKKMYHSTFEINFKSDTLRDLYPKRVIFTDSSFLSIPNIFRTNNYALLYVTDGELIFGSNKTEYSVSEGQCFLVTPGTQSSISFGKITFFKYILIEFSGSLQKNLTSIFSSPVIDAPRTIFNEIINTCHDFQQNENIYYFISGQLLQLYFELSTKKTNYRDFVRNAKKYIDTKYMENITIEDISKLLNMDRHYISRVFKSEVGLSMKAYLLKIRLEKAAALIKDNYTVSEAVQMVGYSDISNFSHKFKEYFGVSPKDYSNKKSVIPYATKEIEAQKSIDSYNWSPKNWYNCF